MNTSLESPVLCLESLRLTVKFPESSSPIPDILIIDFFFEWKLGIVLSLPRDLFSKIF